MGYEGEVLHRANARLALRRKERERAGQALRSRLFTQCPELGDIDRQLRGAILEIGRASCRKRV